MNSYQFAQHKPAYASIDSIPNDDGAAAREFCEELASRLGMDASKVTVSRTFIDPDMFVMHKALRVEGISPTSFSLEELEDDKALGKEEFLDNLVRQIQAAAE